MSVCACGGDCRLCRVAIARNYYLQAFQRARALLEGKKKGKKRNDHLQAFQRAKAFLENLADVGVALTQARRENFTYTCGAVSTNTHTRTHAHTIAFKQLKIRRSRGEVRRVKERFAVRAVDTHTHTHTHSPTLSTHTHPHHRYTACIGACAHTCIRIYMHSLTHNTDGR